MVGNRRNPSKAQINDSVYSSTPRLAQQFFDGPRKPVQKRQRKLIRRKGNRWEVGVTVQGKRISRTYPLDTDDQTMRAWAEKQRVQKLPGECLARDVETYLQTVQHMPSYKERVFHLQWWVNHFGPDKIRTTITTTDINQALSSLKASGKSNTTVRHYRTALLHLYHRLDGADETNPARASWRPADPPIQARAIDPAIVRKILKVIRGPKTKARLWVMASTGIPHKQLMQLVPSSVDWDRSRVLVNPRRKGAGASGRWLPLNRHARFAFRALERAHAWGAFSAQSMRKRWQEALETLKLPKTLRPYDVRHTVGTLLYKATGDLATVARLLGHASTKTAARYSVEAHEAIDSASMAKVRYGSAKGSGKS